MQRLRTFLASEELPPLPIHPADSPSGLAVRISSGEFWWPSASTSLNNPEQPENQQRASVSSVKAEKTEEEKESLLVQSAEDDSEAACATRSVLTDIDMEVERGQVVAIVGEVGAGKSALLHSLLGELHRSNGNDPQPF